jgi:hypothetical protein
LQAVGYLSYSQNSLSPATVVGGGVVEVLVVVVAVVVAVEVGVAVGVEDKQ